MESKMNMCDCGVNHEIMGLYDDQIVKTLNIIDFEMDNN